MALATTIRMKFEPVCLALPLPPTSAYVIYEWSISKQNHHFSTSFSILVTTIIAVFQFILRFVHLLCQTLNFSHKCNFPFRLWLMVYVCQSPFKVLVSVIVFQIKYRTCAIITRGLYIFYPSFHCGLYQRAVYITDHLCTKNLEFFIF